MVRILDITVAVIIGGMIMASLSAYLIDVNRTYNLNVSDDEFETFSKINAIINLSETQGEAVVGADLDKEAESTISLFSGAFSAVKRALTAPFNIASVGKSMVTDSFVILTKLGIKPVFSVGLGALLTVFIIYGLMRAVLKVVP